MRGTIIIDNDQNNADFDQYNDNHQPSYNSSSEGSKVPGYFLTAELYNGKSNELASMETIYG